MIIFHDTTRYVRPIKLTRNAILYLYIHHNTFCKMRGTLLITTINNRRGAGDKTFRERAVLNVPGHSVGREIKKRRGIVLILTLGYGQRLTHLGRNVDNSVLGLNLVFVAAVEISDFHNGPTAALRMRLGAVNLVVEVDLRSLRVSISANVSRIGLDHKCANIFTEMGVVIETSANGWRYKTPNNNARDEHALHIGAT